MTQSKTGPTTAPLEPLVPMDYQEADVRKIVANKGTALLVSAVGGRKTLVAVESALRIKAKSVLIIAPQGTHKRGWVRTILRQSPDANVRRLDSTPKGKEAFADLMWGEPGWYYCTPQWFARQTWIGVIPDYAIFDEIHMAGAYQNVTRVKLHQLKAKARLGLSGTPLRNKIENAWAIVRWLWPDLMADPYYKWRGGPTLTWEYDHFAPQKRRITGEVNPGSLFNSLPCYIQHLARERCCKFHPKGFLDGLQEPEEIILTVQMTPKQKSFYKQMQEHYIAWLTTPGENGKVPVVASLPVVARGMLRFCALGTPSVDPETEKLYFEDDCESPKLDELIRYIKSEGIEKAMVYTHSQKFDTVTVNRLNRAGLTASEWSGKITQRRRDDKLEEFISGDISFLVSVQKAIGTGTDGLQEATNVEFILSDDDDGTIGEQTKGRLDRPGQAERVTRIRIQAEGTMDSGIVDTQIENALRINATLRARNG